MVSGIIYLCGAIMMILIVWTFIEDIKFDTWYEKIFLALCILIIFNFGIGGIVLIYWNL